MAKEYSRIAEIERSIIKTYRKELWAKFVRAIDDYELLKENDKVCVCISGGKDSMILAKLFQELHRHTKFPFEVHFLMMNPGYNKENLDLIMHNLEVLNIPAKIIESNIFEVANSQEKNPCYLQGIGHIVRGGNIKSISTEKNYLRYEKFSLSYKDFRNCRVSARSYCDEKQSYSYISCRFVVNISKKK